MDTTERPLGAPAIDEAPLPPPELEALSPSRRAVPATPGRQITESWLALLNNRFILAVLSVVVVLLLTTVVLVAIGQGGADTGDSPSNVGVPSGTKTPARPLGGLAGTTATTATFRNGPGPTYAVLGTIPRGAVVAVVGRNEDQSWLQVRYPPNSNLKGWVDARLLSVDGDVTKLAISGPGPVPQAQVTFIPTSSIYEPPATETPELLPTRVARPTRTPTPRPTRTPYTPPPATPTPPAKLPTVTPPPPGPVANSQTAT